MLVLEIYSDPEEEPEEELEEDPDEPIPVVSSGASGGGLD